MEYYNKLNKYLEEGYKMSNLNCEVCRKIIIVKDDEYYCLNCQKSKDYEEIEE